MKLLIDGDPIVYRIGFACQTKEEDGSVTADPESHTLHSCKIFINEMLEDTQADSYKIFLTGKGNFRFKIRDDYKANRSKVAKPVHYQMIRDYLVERYSAQVVDGMEADDALALQQTDDTAIATIDKDLLMVAGRHYNYVNKEWKTVTPEDGIRFFYRQMLTGYRVDNITGIKGIGLKKSDKPGYFLSASPEACFPDNWLGSSVPVFFDYQASSKRDDLWCLFPRRADGLYVVSCVTQRHFVDFSSAGPIYFQDK